MTLRWFCISTRANQEDAIVEELKAQNLRGYCPHAIRWRKVRKRQRAANGSNRKRVVRCAFPGYMFVKIDLDHHVRVVRAIDGVFDFVRAGALPVPMPERHIEMMERAEQLHQYDDLRAHTAQLADYLGRLVRVEDGPMIGLCGSVQRILNEERVEVGLQVNGKVVVVSMPVAFIGDVQYED